MAKDRFICRRCHRLRVVDTRRYCANCAAGIIEKPRAVTNTIVDPSAPDEQSRDTLRAGPPPEERFDSLMPDSVPRSLVELEEFAAGLR